MEERKEVRKSERPGGETKEVKEVKEEGPGTREPTEGMGEKARAGAGMAGEKMKAGAQTLKEGARGAIGGFREGWRKGGEENPEGAEGPRATKVEEKKKEVRKEK